MYGANCNTFEIFKLISNLCIYQSVSLKKALYTINVIYLSFYIKLYKKGKTQKLFFGSFKAEPLSKDC